jgi:hypothetical protein
MFRTRPLHSCYSSMTTMWKLQRRHSLGRHVLWDVVDVPMVGLEHHASQARARLDRMLAHAPLYLQQHAQGLQGSRHSAAQLAAHRDSRPSPAHCA